MDVKTVRQRITVPIHGLACGGGGSLSAERAIARLPGVVRAHVNPATEMAYVEYDDALCDPGRIAAAIERVGLRPGTPTSR